MSEGITRREALKGAGAAGLGLGALGGVEGLLSAVADARPGKHGSLADIEHVVIFIQENRSFDHYFGTLSGVQGFGKASHKALTQHGIDGKSLIPFRLPANCMSDITHDWAPQHQAWNGGRMDRFLAVHQQQPDPAPAPETMGYYTRKDLPFYYALADAFTICDHYHCSVIGPTDPNRLMSLSATIDPAGTHGGPLLQTNVLGRVGGFSWRTMPEQLSAKGISWKVYTAGGGGVLDNVLTYFDAFRPGSALAARGLAPTYEHDFPADLAAGKLPQVSWVLLSLEETEHPGFSAPRNGEIGAAGVISQLAAHPDTWRKTALFLTWDENGGFFDHVPPPTPRPGTAGEYLTVGKLPKSAGGIRGPIGLGFRVPMLVVSPFSRGGLVSSHVYDHTSTLRFLETRFRVRVPNLSAWRRKTTGDLTGAFNFAAAPNAARPRLPRISGLTTCASPGPAPVHQGGLPRQERGSRRRPSGIVR